MTARRAIELRRPAAMATAPAVLATLVALCGFTGTASSYLFSRGSGTGHAVVGSLAAPTSVTATVAGSTVSVAWTAATSPAGTADDGYYVQRLAGSTAVAACGSSPSHLVSAASTGCTDSGSPSGSGVPAGTYTYKVTAVFRTWTAQSAASNSATVAPASIGLAPTSGQVGATVAISGQSFAPNSAIAATYDGKPIVLTPATTTTATGSFSGASFTVPTGTAGAHTVQVSDGANTATTSFTLTPAISLAPTSGLVGSTDTVTATGFAPGSHVTATFNGAAVALSGSTTSASGGLSATYTVPGNPQGSYTVQLTDASANSASAAYTISATPPSIAIVSCTGGNGHRNTLAGTTTQSAGTVTVKVFAGAGTEGTPAVTLSTSTFTGSSSPFGWSVTTENGQLTAKSTYTAQATQTGASGTSNSPTCTFTAN